MYDYHDTRDSSSEDEEDVKVVKRTAPTKAAPRLNSGRLLNMSTKLPDFSTKTIGGEKVQPILTNPSQITFASVKPGVLYVMTISVRNNTTQGQRIRISKPSTGYFALNYIPSGITASGLDIRAEVECEIPRGTDGELNDALTITMGPYTHNIPIVAYRSKVDLQFDPFVNFGYIACGHREKRPVVFKNLGDKPADIKFDIRGNSDALQINPPTATVPPGKAVRISIDVRSDTPVVLRELIDVLINGVSENRMLDVNANITDKTLSVLAADKAGNIDALDFGPLFYGEEKTINATIVNSGPQQLSYTISFLDEAKADGIQNNAEESATEDRMINISPSDGVVKPFSRVPITVTFNPVYKAPDKAFGHEKFAELSSARNIQQRCYVESVDIGLKLPLTMTGVVASPEVTSSISVLRFGRCPMYDRRDILVEITNHNNILPVHFEFAKIAHFSMEPGAGSIQAGGTKSVIMTFSPCQLGKFNPVLDIIIAKGNKHLRIQAYGQCDDVGDRKTLGGGLTKTKKDFVPMRKFVDPAEVEAEMRATNAAKREKFMEQNTPADTSMLGGGAGTRNVAAEDSTASALGESSMPSLQMSSQSRDMLYGLASRAASEVGAQEEAWMIKKQHDKQYDNYIKNNYLARRKADKASEDARRMAFGAPDRKDPFGPDMGMERGLEEPIPDLPPADETLWRSDLLDAEGGGGPRRMVVDENRLIQKKFNAVPSTQAEMKDCSRELSSEDLKHVIASTKVLNYGKINIGATVVKNFAVLNDLQNSVYVQILDLPPELKQSKPESQVIPRGSTAGFDIHFCCKHLGEFKKTVTWTVNKFHVYKVLIKAEVVPVELLLDKHELRLSFPDNYLERSYAQEVTLTNPGQSPAEYLWGSADTIKCNPEKGSVPPGKTQVIKVTWTPMQGKRNEEELGLHVVSGTNQTLRVIGDLPEAKAQLQQKTISFGTVAVGTEKVLNTSLINTGNTPVYFHLEYPGEPSGITVEPKKGKIMVGEVADIVIKIIAKTAMKYDKTKLTAVIRGGKAVQVKLEGESIVPQLHIVEPNFNFGIVAVGAQWKVPFTITNNNPIVTSLMVDLDQNSDFRVCLASHDDISVGIKPFDVDELGNCVSLSTYDPLAAAGIASGSKKEEKKLSNVWKITMQPEATIHAALIFIPTAAKCIRFKVPIYLQGIKQKKDHYRDLLADSEVSPLDISSTVVDFADRVVFRDPNARAGYYMEVIFTNKDTARKLSFQIKERENDVASEQKQSDLRPGMSASRPQTKAAETMGPPTFFVGPSEGTLHPGQSVQIRVTFQPDDSISYSKMLDVFVAGQPDPRRAYLQLMCKGTGTYPRLNFNKQGLRLPTVPLGVTSRASFMIVSNGYSSIDLKYRVSPTIPVPLEVSFPEGDRLSIQKDRTKVVVSAKSDTPMSWSGKIEFYDEDNEKFYINVSGCSENCLFTNYPFVKGYAGNFLHVGLDDQPIKYLPKDLVEKMLIKENQRKEELRKQRLKEKQKQLDPNGPGNASPVATSRKSSVLGDFSPKRTMSISEDDKSNVSPSRSLSRQNSEKSISPKVGNLKRSSSKQDVKAPRRSKRKTSLQILAEQDRGIEVESAAQNAEMERVRYSDKETAFILKWMNNFACRTPFDIHHFPECIIESRGDLVVDAIEHMSGRRMKGIKTFDAEPEDKKKNNGRPQTSFNAADVVPLSGEALQNKRIAEASKLVDKFKFILSFLIRSGCMLTHIEPNALLGYEDYMIAQERELKLSEGARLTPTILKDRTLEWQQNWRTDCCSGWMEIIFQMIKIFSLSRVNYKNFTKQPGITMISKKSIAEEKKKVEASMKGDDKDDKKKGPRELIPPEFDNSNCYTNAEVCLLSWATQHTMRAKSMKDDGSAGESNAMMMVGLKNRCMDLEPDFKDYVNFSRILHSHLPELCLPGNPLHMYATDPDSLKNSHSSAAEPPDKYEAVTNALRKLNLDFDLQKEDIEASTRVKMLLILHLYLNLPSLVPRSIIEYQGTLGLPITKLIELSNPSDHRVRYQVTITGSPFFSAGSTEITLPAETRAEVPVTFLPRFSAKANATITFWGIRDGGLAGVSMAYKLSGSVTGRHALGSMKKVCPLYEKEPIEINVTNPFDSPGRFTVMMIIRKEPNNVDDIVRKIKGNMRMRGANFQPPVKKGVKDESYTVMAGKELEPELVCKIPLWCANDVVEIEGKGNFLLTIQCQPFMLGTYTCEVVLTDTKVGEFCYEIVAEIGLPKSYEKLDFTTVQTRGNSIRKALRIVSKNLAFEKGITTLNETRLAQSQKKTKVRSMLQQIMSAPVSSLETGESKFTIELMSPHIQCNKEMRLISEYMDFGVAVPQTARGKASAAPSRMPTGGGKYPKILKSALEDVNDGEDGGINGAILSMMPEKAGVHNIQAIIYSSQTKTDVRVVDLMVKVSAQAIETNIEFEGPARQPLIQEVPVANESSNPWDLTIMSSNQKFFQCPRQLKVPQGETVMLPVTFAAPNIGTFKSTITMNKAGGTDEDIVTYHCVGTALDPLAEAHLTFQCLARNKETMTIKIPTPNMTKEGADLNPGPSTNSSPPGSSQSRKGGVKRGGDTDKYYTITTDLPYVTGPSEVKVAVGTTTYEFSVKCPLSGQMSGSITFLEKDSGAMVWYTVEIDVTSPPEERTIDVEAVVRKAAVVEISLDNPTRDPIDFDVFIEGNGLIGDDKYRLGPGEDELSPRSGRHPTKPYELIFSPLMSGESTGRVRFFNERIGEFWYKLNLNAIPSDPIVLDDVDCMVGLETTVSIPIDNPLTENVSVNLNVYDSDQFLLPSSVLSMGPYAQTSFDVIFRPNNFSDSTEATITASHPKFGEVIYVIRGIGTLPGTMPNIDVFAPLGEMSSTTINFKNPFNHALPVSFILDDFSATEDEHGVFQLLLRGTADLVIPARGHMPIGVAFMPVVLGQYHCNLEARSNIGGTSMLWCYPISGIAESGTTMLIPKITVQCKSTVTKDINIPLTGLTRDAYGNVPDMPIQDFSVDVFPDEKHKSLINRALRVQPLQVIDRVAFDEDTRFLTASTASVSPVLAPITRTGDEDVFDLAFQLRVLFEPLRTFAAPLDIVVSCAGRGRWKIRVDLESSDPEPDDTVQLTAQVGTSDRVTFRLSNRFLGLSPFVAYFTKHSSPHFSVSPGTGVLAPYGSDGTPFVVTFAPLEYGTLEIGTLVVQTEDMQWNYKIIGNYPKNIKKNITSKIDTGLR